MYNNNYYQPAQTYQTQMRQQLGLKGRPVTSIDEAKASPIDFDGSVFYFPDLANGKIYTKQINLDGTATVLVYEFKEMPVDEEQTYVTKREFEMAIENLRKLFATTPPPAADKPVTTMNSKPEFKF